MALGRRLHPPKLKIRMLIIVPSVVDGGLIGGGWARKARPALTNAATGEAVAGKAQDNIVAHLLSANDAGAFDCGQRWRDRRSTFIHSLQCITYARKTWGPQSSPLADRCYRRTAITRGGPMARRQAYPGDRAALPAPRQAPGSRPSAPANAYPRARRIDETPSKASSQRLSVGPISSARLRRSRPCCLDYIARESLVEAAGVRPAGRLTS